MDYAVFANGAFLDVWTAGTAEAAIQMAADDVGTDGDTDGMTAHKVTEAQIVDLVQWFNGGSPAARCPINA